MPEQPQWSKRSRLAIVDRMVEILSKTREALLEQAAQDQRKLRELQEQAQKRT